MNQSNTVILQEQIPETSLGLRLDQALAKMFSQYSRSQLQLWIKAGYVQLDQHIVREPKQKITQRHHVEIRAFLKALENWAPEPIALSIVYEDDDIIVINKPAGLIVHPGAGNPEHTLVNALLHYLPTLATLPRAGIIHRLDKDTTGLLIIVKTLTAHHLLTQALKARTIKREYLALVKGILLGGRAIDAPIGRHPTQRTRMAVLVHGGRNALTHYRVLEKFKAHTLLQVELATGRTHQIRVHLQHIDHPVVGDRVYGKHINVPGKFSKPLQNALNTFQRQALHAWQLTLVHPVSEKPLQFQAPLPEDLQELLNLLREEA